MEFRPLFGTQANIERQKEEQKRTVIDVVFHLIVLRETHEIALLHGGQIIHGCRTYAHHSYNICMCVCVCVCVCVCERERERERERFFFCRHLLLVDIFSLYFSIFGEFLCENEISPSKSIHHTHTHADKYTKENQVYIL